MFGKFLRASKEFFSTDVFHVKNPSIWHAQFYLYWLKKGGQNKVGYRENWCHYWRVVLFHAPRRWLFTEASLWGTLPHWLAMSVSLYFLVRVLIFGIPVPRAILAGLISLPIIAVLVFAGRMSKKFTEWTKDRLVERGHAVDVWGERAGNAVGVLVIIAVLAYVVWAAIQWPLWFGIGVGVIVGIILAAILVTTAVAWMGYWWRGDDSLGHSTQRNVILDNVTGTARFLQFLIVWKRKSCPYVAFDFDPQAHLRD